MTSAAFRIRASSRAELGGFERVRRTLAATLLLGFCGTAPYAKAAELLAQTSLGPVQGKMSEDGSARLWLGIPYAEPPVGERRWRAPVAPASWDQALLADRFGAPCAQIGSIYGPPPDGQDWGAGNVEAFGHPVGSEDCLTLNVWRPDTDAKDLPVIVFVHGGGGVAGYSGDPMYEASQLAVAANAVVVTFNMRLGVFASFLHPALASGDPRSDSGHFGLLDVIRALQFVHDDVAAFGGDPGNVTLAGESAGAIAVYMMMASPLAKGLFHRAIVMSGLFGDPPPADKAHEFSDALLSHLMAQDRLTAPPKDVKQYLQSKSAADLLEVIRGDKLKNPGVPGDGTVVPADVVAAFEQGRYNRVPTIVGTTRDEAKLLAGAFRPTDTERFNIMQAPPRAAAATTSDLIKPWLLPGLGSGLYNAYTRTITWLLMTGVESSVTTLATHAPAVYRYRFDWAQQPEPWRTV